MPARSISHQMDDLSCQEMVKADAGFGIGNRVRSSELPSVMKGSVLVQSGILWNKVKLLHVVGMV